MEFSIDDFKGVPSAEVTERFSYYYVKRVIDTIASFFLLILFIPVYLILAILIKSTSKGPVLYAWNVVGFNGKPFKSWKFRTMVVGADKMKDALEHRNEMTGPVFKIKDDPRITKVGKFLRKYSLDECIQFVSVLKGDMSLVGPRPAFLIEWNKYADWQKKRLSVRPGLTGLWQVSGRNKIEHFDDWVKLDLDYIDNWNLWLDIKILFKTIPAAFRGTGV